MNSPLTVDEALRILRDQADELKAHFAVCRIGVFGSLARGEARQDSDVDVLVEFDIPSFDHYMDLKFHLEAVFKRPVDLVTAASLKPRLKDNILREVRYAA